MSRKIIRFTPDQLGYNDRGKMKWQGLMLSDHSESLRQLVVKEKEVEGNLKPRQTLTEIGALLYEAYHEKKAVTIQANFIQNGHPFKELSCLISGFSEEKIFLRLKENQLVYTTLDNIRHVEFLDPQIWFQKK